MLTRSYREQVEELFDDERSARARAETLRRDLELGWAAEPAELRSASCLVVSPDVEQIDGGRWRMRLTSFLAFRGEAAVA